MYRKLPRRRTSTTTARENFCASHCGALPVAFAKFHRMQMRTTPAHCWKGDNSMRRLTPETRHNLRTKTSQRGPVDDVCKCLAECFTTSSSSEKISDGRAVRRPACGPIQLSDSEQWAFPRQNVFSGEGSRPGPMAWLGAKTKKIVLGSLPTHCSTAIEMKVLTVKIPLKRVASLC